MTPEEFSDLCESIGLVRSTNYINTYSCLYEIPSQYPNPFYNQRLYTRLMTSYSKENGYYICLIKNGEKDLGPRLKDDSEIRKRMYMLQKQLKDFILECKLKNIQEDFKE